MTDAKERIVPCGTCQACCRREWIVLDPAAGDVIEIYETVEVVDPRSGRAASPSMERPAATRLSRLRLLSWSRRRSRLASICWMRRFVSRALRELAAKGPPHRRGPGSRSQPRGRK